MDMSTQITDAGEELITEAFEELESEKRIGISLGGVIRVHYVRYSHR